MTDDKQHGRKSSDPIQEPFLIVYIGGRIVDSLCDGTPPWEREARDNREDTEVSLKPVDIIRSYK